MMKNNAYFTYNTAYGKITIVSDGEAIVQIKHEGKLMPECEKKETALIKQAAKELNEYFSGKRRDFDVPIKLNGTDFHRSVWEALIK
ncbi:MAG: methylated-DNA--[protein]-cysteine methyltransferase, partial [Oscillospiraceae bacterium]|nr:methylated-DNA--[protein]-cysteine methyltransferase [Oscillospiraceae bacterium]